MWQQADSSVVRADAQRLSDSRSSFTGLDGSRGEVIDEHYSLSVVSVVNRCLRKGVQVFSVWSELGFKFDHINMEYYIIL